LGDISLRLFVAANRNTVVVCPNI